MNERERYDFIIFWIIKLNRRKEHKIKIYDEYYDNEISKLKVSEFDKIYRIMLKFKKEKEKYFNWMMRNIKMNKM